MNARDIREFIGDNPHLVCEGCVLARDAEGRYMLVIGGAALAIIQLDGAVEALSEARAKIALAPVGETMPINGTRMQ